MADRPEPRVEEVPPENAQENVGSRNMAGGGEWPSPSTPPQPEDGAPGTSTAPRPSEAPFKDAPFKGAPFKAAVEADPVLGGSGSAPRDAEATDPDSQ
jgi:hypothetical protein